MTNWTQNEWVVTGPPAAIDAFERAALTPGRPAERRLLRPPMPEVPRCLDLPRLVPEPHGLAPADLRTWRAQNWGCDREAEPESYGRTPARSELVFATAWAHPLGAMEALAAVVPNELEIRGSYLEGGNALAGRFTLVRGRLDNVELDLVDGFEMILSGPWSEEE